MPRKRNHAEPNRQASKPSVDEHWSVKREFNRVRADFLKIDVATALTFAGIARQADSDVKKWRNQRAARKAYDTIHHLAKGVDMTNDDAQLLASELARLKRELQTLGEVF